MAIFTKKSPINNRIRTLEIPQYTQDEFDTLYNAYRRGDLLIDEAFNKVSPGAKHFIKTGTTLEEWDNHYATVVNTNNSRDL
jgi:hypothetical protein